MADISRLIPRTPEQSPEPAAENPAEFLDKARDNFKVEKLSEVPAEQSVPGSVSSPVPFVLSEPMVLQKKVEVVLEEGLEQLYRELNPQDQAKFRTLGETTAKKITDLLRQTKFKISEILLLIQQWLMSITGINRYYAEQEAKIKAEKILKLRQEK